MKKIIRYITLSFVMMAGLNSCQERYITYNDAEYVMFADTMAIYPIMEHEQTFTIPVVSTVTRNYDRTFGVEVIDATSNAIERKHYSIESNTITIKAGQRRADVVAQVQKQSGSRIPSGSGALNPFSGFQLTS